jgi:hypothetical protein
MEERAPLAVGEKMWRAQVQSIVANDVEFTKLDNFMLAIPRHLQSRTSRPVNTEGALPANQEITQ